MRTNYFSLINHPAAIWRLKGQNLNVTNENNLWFFIGRMGFIYLFLTLNCKHEENNHQTSKMFESSRFCLEPVRWDWSPGVFCCSACWSEARLNMNLFLLLRFLKAAQTAEEEKIKNWEEQR